MQMPDSGRTVYGEPLSHPTYEGDAGPFAGLVLKTTLLTLITLGFYRFWAKTRIRRYLWSQIGFHGDRLEYTGQGRELLFGFLIVFGIFAALGLATNLLSLGLAGTTPGAEIAVNLMYFALIFYLIPVAQYRARRYRLSRSQWRGVRGGLDGSSFRYGALALGFQIMSLLTLGLVKPWTRLRLFAWRTRNMSFGDRRFGFDGSSKRLFRAWILVWLPGAGIAALTVYAAYLSWDDLAAFFAAAEADPESETAAGAPGSPFANVPGWIFLTAVLLLAMRMIAYVRYLIVEYRYFARHTTYESLRFGSSLTVWRVVWIYLPYWIAMTVMFIGLVFSIGSFSALAGGTAVIGTVVPVLLVFLAFFVLSPMLRYILVIHRLTGLLCRTLEISGDQDFSDILQSAKVAPSRGEGLLEMLDSGGI